MESQKNNSSRPRFGSAQDVSEISGYTVNTLATLRAEGGSPFPYYKVRGRVRYDLDEVEQIIRKTRTPRAALG